MTHAEQVHGLWQATYFVVGWIVFEFLLIAYLIRRWSKPTEEPECSRPSVALESLDPYYD